MPEPAPARAPRHLSGRLSLMFALFTMAEGAVLILLSGHMGAMGFSGRQISYVFATGAVAALVSPLVAGWLADRYWSSQRFLAGCQLVSAPVLLAAWLQTGFAGFWAAMALFALPATVIVLTLVLFVVLFRGERLERRTPATDPTATEPRSPRAAVTPTSSSSPSVANDGAARPVSGQRP